jgi:hypothetical protein
VSGWQPGQAPRRAAERPPAIPPQFRHLPSQREYPPRGYPPAPWEEPHRQPPEPPRRRGPHRGLVALAWGSATLLAFVALVLALRSHPGSGSAAATASAHAVPKAKASRHAAVKPAPSPSCTLTTSFDYIVRTVAPGTPTFAEEIGNVDYADCTGSLADFAATAGQGHGECTTIALASANAGYNVNDTPAPSLKGVLESAGPGCRKATARPRPRRPAASRGTRPSPTASPGARTPTTTPTPTLTPSRLRPTTSPRACPSILCPSGQPTPQPSTDPFIW